MGLRERLLLASERSERDTIRGVQTRADAVRIYIYICMRYVCHNTVGDKIKFPLRLKKSF